MTRCEHCGTILDRDQEWTETEDFRLADLLATGFKSMEIASQMRRSVYDVRKRIVKLKLATGREMGLRRKIQRDKPTPAQTVLERYFECV